jgi:hypothetical protein
LIIGYVHSRFAIFISGFVSVAPSRRGYLSGWAKAFGHAHFLTCPQRAIDPTISEIFYTPPTEDDKGGTPSTVNLNPPGLIKTPTLHVLGRTDVIVGMKRSQSLVDACDTPRVEWHEGGQHADSLYVCDPSLTISESQRTSHPLESELAKLLQSLHVKFRPYSRSKRVDCGACTSGRAFTHVRNNACPNQNYHSASLASFRRFCVHEYRAAGFVDV